MARPPKPLDPSKSGIALFGSTVRKYRTDAGETLAGLAVKINYATSTIGDVERGHSRCERDFAEGCDEAFETGGTLAHLWDYLVKDSVYPRWFADWPGIEEKAVSSGRSSRCGSMDDSKPPTTPVRCSAATRRPSPPE